jgi:hypothetical protein
MRTRASVKTEEQALSAAVIAQERKRKSSRGWCIELIAGTTATLRFAGPKTLAKNWNGISGWLSE